MPVPAAARVTNSKHPRQIAFLEAEGFGQRDGHVPIPPEHPEVAEAAQAKKHKILDHLANLPSEPARMLAWVEECMALGALSGGWGDHSAYLAVRTEVLHYRFSTSERKIEPGYRGTYRLYSTTGFTHSLRVPADVKAFFATVFAPLKRKSPEDLSEDERQRLVERRQILQEFDQLESIAKVALAFSEDDKAHVLLSYGLRRVENWSKQ